MGVSWRHRVGGFIGSVCLLLAAAILLLWPVSCLRSDRIAYTAVPATPPPRVVIPPRLVRDQSAPLGEVVPSYRMAPAMRASGAIQRRADLQWRAQQTASAQLVSQGGRFELAFRGDPLRLVPFRDAYTRQLRFFEDFNGGVFPPGTAGQGWRLAGFDIAIDQGTGATRNSFSIVVPHWAIAAALCIPPLLRRICQRHRTGFPVRLTSDTEGEPTPKLFDS